MGRPTWDAGASSFDRRVAEKHRKARTASVGCLPVFGLGFSEDGSPGAEEAETAEVKLPRPGASGRFQTAGEGAKLVQAEGGESLQAGSLALRVQTGAQGVDGLGDVGG